MGRKYYVYSDYTHNDEDTDKPVDPEDQEPTPEEIEEKWYDDNTYDIIKIFHEMRDYCADQGYLILDRCNIAEFVELIYKSELSYI